MKLILMWDRKARRDNFGYERRFLFISKIAFDKGAMLNYLGAGTVLHLNKHIMIVDVKGELDGFSEELKKEGYEVYKEAEEE